MSSVTWSVCSSVLETWMSCGKTAKPTEMLDSGDGHDREPCISPDSSLLPTRCNVLLQRSCTRPPQALCIVHLLVRQLSIRCGAPKRHGAHIGHGLLALLFRPNMLPTFIFSMIPYQTASPTAIN